MNPLQIATVMSQLHLHIMELLENSRRLEEDANSLHSISELLIAERLQYGYIASDFQSQFGVAITSLPIFFGGEYVERTRTVVGADGRRESRRYHFWKLEHPFLNDDDENQVNSYRATYRMSKRAFEHLVNELSLHEAFNLVAPNTIPIYIQIATALFRLANSHIGYRQAYMHLGVSYGSYNNFTKRTVKAIKGRLGHLVAWPTDPEEAGEVALGFGSNDGRRLSHVIGAVDGKNFKIHKPSGEAGGMFRDRKNDYSVKLTAVCDSELRFTYIRVGDSGIVTKAKNLKNTNMLICINLSGRTHDAAAFTSSDLFRTILANPETYFPGRTFLVGDSAYPLGPNLITPFPESQCLVDSNKRTFNHIHSATRMAIERAFGVLVARWRFTGRYIYLLDQLSINEVITSACILHNMCIDLRDPGFTDVVLENIRGAVGTEEGNSDINGNDRRTESLTSLIRTRTNYRNRTREV